MRGCLQSNRRHTRNRILTAARHPADLLENQIVEFPGRDLGKGGVSCTDEEREAEEDFCEILFQNAATHIGF